MGIVGKPHPLNRRQVLILLLIVFVAAFMRMGDLEAMSHFRYDQGYISEQALDIVSGKPIATLGLPSSGGVPHSPFNQYFMVVPYLISDSPQFATLFVAAWLVVGVALLWFLAYRYLGPTVAFLAGLAYALNPPRHRQQPYHLVKFRHAVYPVGFYPGILRLW